MLQERNFFTWLKIAAWAAHDAFFLKFEVAGVAEAVLNTNRRTSGAAHAGGRHSILRRLGRGRRGRQQARAQAMLRQVQSQFVV